MQNSRTVALAVWLLFLAVCAWLVTQARFTADMSAFLPTLPSAMQRLLAEQLRDGVASRLILAGIEGAAPEELAKLSNGVAKRLEGRSEFVYVANGEARIAQADRDFLFAHRYVLSPSIAPERFDRPALAAALERAYEALASPASVLIRRYLPADPTGEFLRVLRALEGQARPATHAGVWISRDQRTALVLAQTAAAGFDVDAQARNLASIEEAFAAARAESGVASAVLHTTGPAVFAVRSRDAMRDDVRRLSALGAGLVALLLFVAFRSPRLVLLAFVPVATGALAGVAAVAAAFDTVHAVTLGFGVTLVGEAVDYAIYFFSQRRAAEVAARSLARILPTLRLGMLISIASFCAMLFSGFPGLAQLGLFSAAGLLVALASTRYVLPHLVGQNGASPLADTLVRVVPRWHVSLRLRMSVIMGIFVAAIGVVWSQRPIWDDDLARLNPVSAADQALDQRLRAELGAPDVRLLVVASAASQEEVLERCESIAAQLDALVRQGAIAGFDAPCTYLPSRVTQAARKQALPGETDLRAALRPVVAASPFQPDLFEPFIRDVAAAKAAPPLERASFRGTALALKLHGLLVERQGAWHALIPLRSVTDVATFAERSRAMMQAGAELLDIKHESTTLLATYRAHALRLWALGLAVIIALLLWHLRAPARVLTVIAPLAAAVAVTCAVLLAAGAKLTLFHLVALLLVVGVGSNYALFFEQPALHEAERRGIVFAVVFCAATTAIVFGLLAWSRIPVLQMIGATVALGAAASLALSALVARGTKNESC